MIAAELESCLLNHPQVEDCAVVGIYSNRQQREGPQAYVVIKGKDFSAANAQNMQDIMKRFGLRSHELQALTWRHQFLSATPKSPSGKIVQRTLKEQAESECTKAGEPLRTIAVV